MEKRRIRLLGILSERTFDHTLKRLLILCRCALRHASQHVFHQLRMRAAAGADIVHHRIDITAAAAERRVNIPQIRLPDHPVAFTGADAVLLLAVTQRGLGQIDRADRAQQVFVNLFGLLLRLPRGGFGRYIVHIVINQNEIVARIGILRNDLLIQPVQQLFIRQLAAFEHQQVLLAFRRLLGACKLQLKQVAAQRTGQRFLRNL